MSIWDRFDDIASTEEVQEAQSRYTPIEEGDYEAVLKEIAPAESSKGTPMVKGKFQIVDGGRYLFYNKVLANLNYPDMTAGNIADAVEFASQLKGEPIEFTGLSQFAEELNSLEVGDTYRIRVRYGEKDVEHKFPNLRCLGKVEETPFD